LTYQYRTSHTTALCGFGAGLGTWGLLGAESLLQLQMNALSVLLNLAWMLLVLKNDEVRV
jgi:hypothetical protein